MSKEALISINIDKKQTLVFYDNYFLYKGKHITYKDIDGISYLLTVTKQSISFIPTAITSSFDIKFEAKGEVYTVNSSASGVMYFKGERQKEKEQIFSKIVYIIDNLIKPFALINLLIKFNKEGELKLGDSLTIKPDGIYKKRLWRDPLLLTWDKYFNSSLFEGNFYIFESDFNDKPKNYFTCPMSVMNAVIMPDFLKFLFHNKGVIDGATKKELDKRKREFDLEPPEEKVSKKEGEKFCSSCAAPIEADSRFCTHCGSKLL